MSHEPMASIQDCSSFYTRHDEGEHLCLGVGGCYLQIQHLLLDEEVLLTKCIQSFCPIWNNTQSNTCHIIGSLHWSMGQSACCNLFIAGSLLAMARTCMTKSSSMISTCYTSLGSSVSALSAILFLAHSRISLTVSLSSHMLTLLNALATLLSVPLRYSMLMSKPAKAATHLCLMAFRLGVIRM